MSGSFLIDDNTREGSGGFTQAGDAISQEMEETGATGVGPAIIKTRASRSAKTTTHSAVAASSTSAEIDLSNFSKALVKVTIAGATSGGSVKVHGALATGDAVVQVYDSGAKTTSFWASLSDIPGFLKVELAWTDGTWTIEVQGLQ